MDNLRNQNQLPIPIKLPTRKQNASLIISDMDLNESFRDNESNSKAPQDSNFLKIDNKSTFNDSMNISIPDMNSVAEGQSRFQKDIESSLLRPPDKDS